MNDKDDTDNEAHGALVELIRELIPYAYDDGEDPPNEASADECVEYAADEIKRLRKTVDGVSRSLAAVVNGWPYEHEPVLHVSQALKLACDTIDDLRRGNEHMRRALEDIREWSKRDDFIRFDDGDISLADYCARALHGGK